MPRLDEGCYWGKRERERERCVSSADASTYGPEWARCDPWHVCPQLTHAKTTPHHAIRLSPLPRSMCVLQKRLKSIQTTDTQTRSISMLPSGKHLYS
jgi:hypothetical protein